MGTHRWPGTAVKAAQHKAIKFLKIQSLLLVFVTSLGLQVASCCNVKTDRPGKEWIKQLRSSSDSKCKALYGFWSNHMSTTSQIKDVRAKYRGARLWCYKPGEKVGPPFHETRVCLLLYRWFLSAVCKLLFWKGKRQLSYWVCSIQSTETDHGTPDATWLKSRNLCFEIFS